MINQMINQMIKEMISRIMQSSTGSRMPTESECLELMSEVGLAPAITNHSIAVKNIALEFAGILEEKGIEVDKSLVSAAALLHDIRKMDAFVCHGIEGGDFLRNKGFPAVADVVEKHCINNLDDPSLIPSTVEEKLLMYSDLRINAGRKVSLDERFDYIKQRYNPRNMNKFGECLTFARQIEWELFGEKKK